MPYPENIDPIRDRSNEFECPACGNKWQVNGTVDMGYWEPNDEKDERCFVCGHWGELNG